MVSPKASLLDDCYFLGPQNSVAKDSGKGRKHRLTGEVPVSEAEVVRQFDNADDFRPDRIIPFTDASAPLRCPSAPGSGTDPIVRLEQVGVSNWPRNQDDCEGRRSFGQDVRSNDRAYLLPTVRRSDDTEQTRSTFTMGC